MSGPAAAGDEFVSAATFWFPDEPEVARSLLRSCGILCYLANEHTLSKVWPWNIVLGGLRLMVPASLLEQVHKILDGNLVAHAGFDTRVEESGSPGVLVRRRTRTVLAIAVLCAPTLSALRLFYVGS